MAWAHAWGFAGAGVGGGYMAVVPGSAKVVGAVHRYQISLLELLVQMGWAQMLQTLPHHSTFQVLLLPVGTGLSLLTFLLQSQAVKIF